MRNLCGGSAVSWVVAGCIGIFKPFHRSDPIPECIHFLDDDFIRFAACASPFSPESDISRFRDGNLLRIGHFQAE